MGKCLSCCYYNINYDNELLNSEFKSTKKFCPSFKECWIIRVIDGDTVHGAVRLGEGSSCNRYKKKIVKFSIRLARIDAPEIKGKNLNEKICAKVSRDRLK